MDVSQRNLFKWLLSLKRQIDADLYKQISFGNELKKETQRHSFAIYITPQLKRDWF